MRSFVVFASLMGVSSAFAQPCIHPTTQTEFALLGDINASGSVNVADSLCTVLASLAELADPANPVWPSCLAVDPELADPTCDDSITVSDVQLGVGLALGLGVPVSLDAVGDGCVDACTPCDPGPGGEDNACAWGNGPDGSALRSADGAATLSVPPGTLPSTVKFEVHKVDSPPAGATLVSDAYEFGPDGLTFASPVDLCFDFDDPTANLDDLCLGYYDEASAEWICEGVTVKKVTDEPIVCCQTTHFTTFALLLSSAASPGGSGCDDDDESTYFSGKGGGFRLEGQPAFAGLNTGAVRVPTRITIEPVATPPVDAPRITPVFEIGPSGKTFDEPMSVCLQHAEAGDVDLNNHCLGFLDEGQDPPEWKCEDSCLEDVGDNWLCGKTDHLTNFAILLGGEGGSSCDEDDEGSSYVLGSKGGPVLFGLNNTKKKVEVPIGALLEPTMFTGTTPDPSTPAGPVVSEPIELGPSGTFDAELEVCLEYNGGENVDDLCLGFVNDDDEWVCEDACLESKDNGQLCGKTNHFTNFALLLGGEGGGSCECDCDEEEDFVVDTSGGFATLLGGSLQIQVPPGAVTVQTTLTAAELTEPPSPGELVSQAFDLGPDGATFAVPLRLCLQTDGQLADRCLAFYDESGSPPEWKCEDKCLQAGENDLVCGQTDHFSAYSIKTSPGAGGGECE